MSPEFKDTKTGEVPKEWKVVSLKEITVNLIGGGTPSTSQPEYWDGDIPWMTSANLTDRIVLRGMRNITKEGLQNSATNIIPKGSLLISTRVGIGKVGIAGIDIGISQDLTGLVLDINKVDVEYLYWALRNKSSHLGLLSQGSTVKGLTRDYLRNLKFLLPPLPEQKKIAEILSTVDQAIEKVDEAIEKTQKLKKGLMQELLTKGIGHKEFKETEIGRLPKEWGVVRISAIADVKGGKRLPKGQKLVNFKTPYPYIRVLDFKDMGIDVNNIQFLLPETQKSIRQYTISSNDVYISIAGTVGIVGVIPSELDNANLTENAAKLCNLRDITKEFLAYFLNSSVGQSQISTYLGKAQQPKLALFRIEKIRLPLPSLPEQQKIAEILSTVDKRLESLRNRKEKLKRIKKGLMSDLLTGRVRVKLN